jgi:hypothetical protein
MAAWLQDLTHWLRRLLKSPGFVAAVVIPSRSSVPRLLATLPVVPPPSTHK